jgi:glycosyltransferase involved in cell wall biosynthesis
MRVTFICLEWPHEGHVGGVGRYAYRLASSLVAVTGIELAVVTFDGGLPLAGASMHFIPRASGRIGRFYGAPLRLRSVVTGTEPDVVHSFGDDWALPVRTRAPLVRTFLGSSLSEARSSSGLRKLNHYVLAVTEFISQKRSAYRIGIGPESFRAFGCDLLMPPVVPVAEGSRPPKTSGPSVVFIGSYGGRKRGRLVEDAVAEVSRRLDQRPSLTVIGPQSDAPRWSPEIVHISDASDGDVADIVARSWALMAPSSYEGFGIPTFEALSLGTPVIASSNPGSDYVLSLTEPAGALEVVADEHLASRLERRLRRGPKLDEDEERGRRRAVETLLRDASVERLKHDVYDVVAAPTRRGAADA